MCAAVYPAVSTIVSLIKCSKPEVSVYPDFDKTQSEAVADIKVKITLFSLLVILAKGLVTAIKTTKMLKKLSDGDMSNKIKKT